MRHKHLQGRSLAETEDDMQEIKVRFFVLCWPNGEVTIALDRDYSPEEVETV